MPFITRPQLANRHNVTPRTVARRQEDDPNYPKSRIIRGYHYFDLDEVEAYERALAGAPRIPKASPIARPSSNHTDATARSTAVDDVADRRVGRRRLLAVAGRGPPTGRD